jgi:hypothetical protein
MQTALTDEQLFKAAPSIFATEPWAEVSKRYAFIPTSDVVESLRSEGFMPVKAMQSRSRIEEKKNFTKHMIRFRRAEDMQRALVPGMEVPEIVLVNSHDRTSSYQLSAGIFRVVCSNGMVVKSSNFGDLTLPHTGNIKDSVIEGSARIIEEMPHIMESMERMKLISLSPMQQMAYAESALTLRYPLDETGNNTAPIDANKLLTVHRSKDSSNDLWTTFNRVQENFIKGGLRGVSTTGKRMSTRAISSVTEDLRINKALWLLTEKMTELVN